MHVVCASKKDDEVGRAVHAQPREPTPLRPGSLADLHYGPVLFPVPCRAVAAQTSGWAKGSRENTCIHTHTHTRRIQSPCIGWKRTRIDLIYCASIVDLGDSDGYDIQLTDAIASLEPCCLNPGSITSAPTLTALPHLTRGFGTQRESAAACSRLLNRTQAA